MTEEKELPEEKLSEEKELLEEAGLTTDVSPIFADGKCGQKELRVRRRTEEAEQKEKGDDSHEKVNGFQRLF